MFIDKPIFKPKEKIQLTVYYYNVITKRPLTHCQQNLYPGIQIKDADNKFIKRVNVDHKKIKKLRKSIKDFSSFHYEIEIDDKFKGGVYEI